MGNAMISIPLRTKAGLNDRELWRARARRVKQERATTFWALIASRAMKPPLPCSIRITRVAPSNGLDDDNLAGSLKAVRDQVAEWLGIDDKSERVRYVYAQQRGPWGVLVEFGRYLEATKFEAMA